MTDDDAPPIPLKVWVCLACGKRSFDRYGEAPIDKGWDEACFLNSAIVDAAEAKRIHDDLRLGAP